MFEQFLRHKQYLMHYFAPYCHLAKLNHDKKKRSHTPRDCNPVLATVVFSLW